MKVENYKDYNLKVDLTDNKLKLNKVKDSSEDLKTGKSLVKDKVLISDEAKKILEEQKLIEKENKDHDAEMFKDMLKQVKESSNPKNNPYSNMMKCIEIATRIINGDKVPGKDEQFLMEHEPKMYTSAVMLRQQKETPKKHDSLLEDEDNKDNNSLEGNDIESASAVDLPAEVDTGE